jgi:anti-anti-sigma factor
MAANPVEFPQILRLEIQPVTEGVTMVACSGRLPSGTVEQFKRQVKPLLSQNRRIVFDLTDLNYMDSSELGALVSVHVSARGAHCEL